MRSLLGRLALACAALLLAVGAVEVALRVAGYRPPLSSDTILNTPTRDLDADVLSVDRSFKDDNFYRPYQDAGANVVVALGDSFTLGYPVRTQDAYPSVLEHLLRDRLPDSRVMNLGMGDTGPDQQLKLFTTYVLPRVKPDIVIWQFYPNDSYDNAIKPLFSISPDDTLVPLDARRNFLYRRQRFYDAIPLPAGVKRNSYVVNLGLRWFEQDLFAQVPAGADFLDWARRKIALELQHMNVLARQHGFRVYYVLVAPQAIYRTDVEPGSVGDRDATEHRVLLRIFEPHGGFIDARFDAAHGGSVDAGAELFDDGSRDRSAVGGRHFNEAGYARLAEAIANRIVRDGQ